MNDLFSRSIVLVRHVVAGVLDRIQLARDRVGIGVILRQLQQQFGRADRVIGRLVERIKKSYSCGISCFSIMPPLAPSV